MATLKDQTHGIAPKNQITIWEDLNGRVHTDARGFNQLEKIGIFKVLLNQAIGHLSDPPVKTKTKKKKK